MNKQPRQQGFTVMQILLVIMIIITIGLIGWMVANKKDDKKTQDSSKTASQQQSTDEQTSQLPLRKVSTTTYKKAPEEVRTAILNYNKEHVPACVESNVIVENDGTAADREVVLQDEDGKLGVGSLAETSVGCDGSASTLFAKNKEGKWAVLQATQDYYTCDVLSTVIVTSEFLKTATTTTQCLSADGSLVEVDTLYL